MRRTLIRLAAVAALALLAARPAEGFEAVEPTNAGGRLRTGWYPDESSITPELVSGGTFGKLWSAAVEGQVYAQPLLSGGRLLVATEDNMVYSLNPATGAQNWSKTLLGTPWNPEEISCNDLTPQIGVTSTPVIDTATNTAYLTHKAYESGHSGPVRWYMDAIDLATGAERSGFPVVLAGSAQNAPAQKFAGRTQLQRPGLLLLNGVVYAAFGSDCDAPSWDGWVFGVSEGGEVKARWVADETGEGAGIWQSGAGLTSDGPETILLSTGNGEAPDEPRAGDDPPSDLGESIVRLHVQPDGSLEASDFFAPFNAASLDSWDADFASGGVTGLPGEFFGTGAVPHLAVAVGKDGYVYLLNRDDLGGIGQGPSGSDDVVQRLGPYGGVWSRPGVWPGEGGWVYIPTASGGESASGSSGKLYMYRYGLSGSGAPSLSLQGVSSEAFGFSSSAPVITSAGTAPGSALVWLIWSPNGGGEGAQLRAYDPQPVAGKPVLRWSAPIGTASKFNTPGVGAGRLYVGTRDGHVLGFGSPITPLLSGPPTNFPTTTLGATSKQTLTLTATAPLSIASLASSSPQFVLGTPSRTLPATMLTGETIDIPISFSPSATGPLAATLTATTGDGHEVEFSLTGAGQASGPKLEATPPLVTFGGTSIGAELEGTATFRNVGALPLEVEAVTPPSGPFAASEVPPVGSTIAPGSSVTIDVSFKPTEVGVFESEIELATSGGDEAVGLSGSAGTPGDLSISSENNQYGSVALGTTAARSFTITNVGGTAVEITKSKPPVGGEFSATTTLGEGTTIEPGASDTETVVFTPTALGPAAAVWPINGIDSSGLHEVRFSGSGVESQASLPLVQSGAGGLGILASTESLAPRSPDAELASTALIAGARGTLALHLTCPPGSGGCAGTVRLLSIAGASRGAHGAGAAARAAILTLASARFSVPAGARRTVVLHLSRAARALLAQRHVLRARAIVVAHSPAHLTHTTSRIVTIRPPRRGP